MEQSQNHCTYIMILTGMILEIIISLLSCSPVYYAGYGYKSW